MNTVQNIFTGMNVALFYLSPYLDLRYVNQGLLIYQRILNKKILICGEKESIERVFIALRDGLTFDELSSLIKVNLHNYSSDDWIYLCMQNGIIE